MGRSHQEKVMPESFALSAMTEPTTPGPWFVESGAVYAWKPFDPQLQKLDSPRVSGNQAKTPIANMDREPGNGTQPVERDANAYLIAAAPDLLEALQRVMDALAYEGLDEDNANQYEEGDAAIAKAKGLIPIPSPCWDQPEVTE